MIQKMLAGIDDPKNNSREQLIHLLKRISWLIQELPNEFKSHSVLGKVISATDWNYLKTLPYVLIKKTELDVKPILQELQKFGDCLKDFITVQQSENPEQELRKIASKLYDKQLTSRLPEIEKLVLSSINSDYIKEIIHQINLIEKNFHRIETRVTPALVSYFKIAIFRSIEIIGENYKKLSKEIVIALGTISLKSLREKITHLRGLSRKFIQDQDLKNVVDELKNFRSLLTAVENGEEIKLVEFKHINQLAKDFPNPGSDVAPLARHSEKYYTDFLEKVFTEEVRKLVLAPLKAAGKQASGVQKKDINLSQLVAITKKISEAIYQKNHLLDAFYNKIFHILGQDEKHPGDNLSDLREFLNKINLEAEIIERIVQALEAFPKNLKIRDLKKKLVTIVEKIREDHLKRVIPETKDHQDIILELTTTAAREKFDQLSFEIEELLEPIQAAIDEMKEQFNYEALFDITEPICCCLQKKLQEIGDLANVLNQNPVIAVTLSQIKTASINTKRLAALLLLRNALSHSAHELSSVEIRAVVLSLLLKGRNDLKNISALLLDEKVISYKKILSHTLSVNKFYEPVIDEKFIG